MEIEGARQRWPRPVVEQDRKFVERRRYIRTPIADENRHCYLAR